MNFDESIKRLKEICAKLDDDKTTLEDTVALYKEGMALSEECLKRINDIRSELKESGEEIGEA
ncbi:MAG: exodeoxyribonuclease VII small subunit [Oscillospiraceae bacterium]|nr:exodeoxyribonuclease VII small subunit [Oscillospiraceae bacterium]